MQHMNGNGGYPGHSGYTGNDAGAGYPGAAQPVNSAYPAPGAGNGRYPMGGNPGGVQGQTGAYPANLGAGYGANAPVGPGGAYPGNTGYVGNTGVVETGNTGYTGNVRISGNTGNVGYPGDTGNMGYPGNTGNVGYPGNAGAYTGNFPGYDAYEGTGKPAKPKRRPINIRILAGVLIGLVGLGLFSSYFIDKAVKSYAMKKRIDQFENDGISEIIIDDVPTEDDSLFAAEPDPGDVQGAASDPTSTDPAPSQISMDGSDVKEARKRNLQIVGKIRIEKIDVTLLVVYGADAAALNYGVGQLRGSTDIGKEGNTVIAGHRAYTNGDQFSRLEKVSLGDVVEIVTQDKHYLYEVKDLKIVEPDDETYYKAVPGKFLLTLFTCHPKVTSTYRMIKICELVKVTDKAGNELPMPTAAPQATPTQEPKATKTADEADGADEADEPDATKKPDSSKKPDSTKKPGSTKESDATKKPGATDSTKKPTDAPEETDDAQGRTQASQ